MSEMPNSNMPEASAPSTKYLSPASLDLAWSRSKAASTYSARLDISSERYNDKRLAADAISIMPRVENSISMTHSKGRPPSSRSQSTDKNNTRMVAASNKYFAMAEK